MSLSQRTDIARAPVNGDLIEKVILQNDLSGLSPVEKVQHIKNICDSLGLNPTTHPIALMKFQGKEIPYMKKDATEQLRKLNRVSITSMDSKMLSEGIYVVTATASTPDGRQDSSTGVISIGGLKGEAIANAMMKAETKAKRRVTLSICGLGFLDESEIDSMPGHTRYDDTCKPQQVQQQAKIVDLTRDHSLKVMFEKLVSDMQDCQNAKSLKSVFDGAKIIDWNGSGYLKMLVEAKDKRKLELTVSEFNTEYDSAPDTAAVAIEADDDGVIQ